MIAVTIAPAAYRALKTIRPNTYETRAGATDGMCGATIRMKIPIQIVALHRSTLTTVKPAAGDHVIDVFIAPCCRIPSQGASQPTSARASHPASPAPESIRPGLSAARRQTLASGCRQPPIIVAGEGLETIMSLGTTMPTLLMRAGFSASNLAALLLPLSLGRLYIALEPDPAATSANRQPRRRAANKSLTKKLWTTIANRGVSLTDNGVKAPSCRQEGSQTTMANLAIASSREQPEDKIVRHAAALSGQLQSLRERMYPPHAQKALRNFMTQEVSTANLDT